VYLRRSSLFITYWCAKTSCKCTIIDNWKILCCDRSADLPIRDDRPFWTLSASTDVIRVFQYIRYCMGSRAQRNRVFEYLFHCGNVMQEKKPSPDRVKIHIKFSRHIEFRCRGKCASFVITSMEACTTVSSSCISTPFEFKWICWITAYEMSDVGTTDEMDLLPWIISKARSMHASIWIFLIFLSKIPLTFAGLLFSRKPWPLGVTASNPCWSYCQDRSFFDPQYIISAWKTHCSINDRPDADPWNKAFFARSITSCEYRSKLTCPFMQ